MDSELLFLLIIILTVVINIVKAINKKKRPPVQEAAPAASADPALPPVESDWQRVLRELLGESPAPVRPSTHEYAEEAESLETLEPLGGYITENTPYNFNEIKYTTPSITDTDEPFDVQQTITSAPMAGTQGMVSRRHDLWDDLRNFDLRKAVIYSAILNRPYA